MVERRSMSPFGSLVAVPVQVLLSAGLQVEGSIVVSSEPHRFSDAWEEVMKDSRAFLAVTDAETHNAADGTFEQKDAFLLLRKTDIIAVRPIEEP